MNVVKFPYSACRRVHARRGQISKNGTPEERAAKAPTAEKRPQNSNPLRAKNIPPGIEQNVDRSGGVTAARSLPCPSRF